MKFLLMSQAVENESIKQALLDLVGKPFAEANVLMVTTASNAAFGDKRWLIRMFNQFDSLGFAKIDIIDFAGLPEDAWLPQFEAADVLMFTGGNTTHLAYEMGRANMKQHLEKLLGTRVYASNSAGSIVTGASLAMVNEEDYAYAPSRIDDLKAATSLGYHGLHIRPHWKNPGHSRSTESWVEAKIAENNITDPVYLLDDQSALKIDGDQLKVVSEGEWKVYNEV